MPEAKPAIDPEKQAKTYDERQAEKTTDVFRPESDSLTGPKVSSDTITPVVASMPMPHRATRQNH